MNVRTWHHRDSNITIEISGRQSGRTQRIIDKAIHHLRWCAMRNKEAKVIIVVINEQTKRSIRDRFNETLSRLGLNRTYRNRLVVHSAQSLGSDAHRRLYNFAAQENNRIYFDEFELMNFDGDRIPIFVNSFYAANPINGFRESETFRIMSTVTDNLETRELDFGNFYMQASHEERTRFHLDRALNTDAYRAQYTQEYSNIPTEELNEHDAYLERLGV